MRGGCFADQEWFRERVVGDLGNFAALRIFSRFAQQSWRRCGDDAGGLEGCEVRQLRGCR